MRRTPAQVRTDTALRELAESMLPRVRHLHREMLALGAEYAELHGMAERFRSASGSILTFPPWRLQQDPLTKGVLTDLETVLQKLDQADVEDAADALASKRSPS